MKLLFAFRLLFFIAAASFVAAEPVPDRALSPYFQVNTPRPGTDGGGVDSTDPLPLKSTRVDVILAGVFAEVTVTQHYANRGHVPLEAIYIFPGSTRAAVH